jgi:predicted kinase
MKILSPDQNILDLSGGVYSWSPRNACVAWQKTYRDLGKLISSQRPGRLLLLVGPSGAGKSHHLAENTAELAERYAAVVDAMFLTVISRSAVASIAVGAGWSVDAIVFNTSLATLLKRAKSRPDRRVPKELLRNMHRKLQPPTTSEGFENVYNA